MVAKTKKTAEKVIKPVKTKTTAAAKSKATKKVSVSAKVSVKMAQPKTRKTTPSKKNNLTESPKRKVDTPPELISRPTTAQTLLSYGVHPYPSAGNEPYMNERQKAHFEKLLDLWLNDLLQGGDDTISDLQESSEVPADLSDQASKEEEFALKLRKRDRERKLIKKIEESLQKLKSDDYGYCEECGIEIGVRRLEARPTATLCIDCKTIAEIKERQQRT